MNLAVDCPGLTHVDILLVSPHDIGFIHTQLKSAWAVQNVNQLLDKSDLHKLVWCDKLQDIRFLHRYDLHEEYGKRRHEELALVRDVIRWLEDAFRWKNPNRHIVICDLGWLPRRNQLDEFAALSSE